MTQFEINKELYESNMYKHTGRVLACDHTFRTSKHIGITRDDGKFIRQFENVFLGLNENGEVMVWRFTKSTSSAEIIYLLKQLKDRLDEAAVSLEIIVVDDCCHSMSLYKEIFPGEKIRLDLFHACSRIVQTVAKSESFSKTFSNELSLIFRKDGDLDNERAMNTADPDEIEANLERLLFVWNSKLKKETLHQIENLRKHIRKGCLSDIPPGCGTELNERLHRHLNRSLLCGVSKIGPELAIAVMTCALYAWNCKRKGKTLHNKRTAPITPIELETLETNAMVNHHHLKVGHCTPSSSSSQNVPKSESEKNLKSENKLLFFPFNVFKSANSVEELKCEIVLHYIIQRVLHFQEFLNKFTERCENKGIDIISLLWSVTQTVEKLVEDETNLNTLNFDLSFQHIDNLNRNLSGFKLKVDEVPKDGNCLFRAISRQLNKHLTTCHEEKLQHHISVIGLGKSEKDDTAKLRELFVRELSENIDNYKEWMSGKSILTEINNFKDDGYYASEVGDICTRACANILRIPIVLVTALPTVPTIPFLPQDFVTSVPIYIAYDHSGSGHYDATKGKYLV